MSTHNLCFGAKLRNIGIPQFCYIKVGFMGVYITRTCYPDENFALSADFGFEEQLTVDGV